jgi:hypothetical protein
MSVNALFFASEESCATDYASRAQEQTRISGSGYLPGFITEKFGSGAV